MVAVDGERKRRRPSRRTRSGGQRRPTTPSASHRGPVVPRAIATSADCASLDLVGKFTQDSNSELQVAVNPASQGLVSKIGLEVTNISCSLILHWGVLRPDKRDWILPSRQPDGTTVYKNRALRTPFVKGIDDKVITVVFREGGTEFTAIVVDVGTANNSEPVLLLTEEASELRSPGSHWSPSPICALSCVKTKKWSTTDVIIV